MSNNPFKHSRMLSAKEEVCSMCGKDAWHKVGEEILADRHNFTAYVCCGCFGEIFGPLAVRWCNDLLW